MTKEEKFVTKYKDYKTGLNDTTMEVEIGENKAQGGSVPGGGCDVGLGALALLAVVAALFRKH